MTTPMKPRHTMRRARTMSTQPDPDGGVEMTDAEYATFRGETKRIDLNHADEQNPIPGVEGVLRANADLRSQLERVRAIVEGRTGEVTTVDVVQRIRNVLYAPPHSVGGVLPKGATWTGTPEGDELVNQRAVETWWAISHDRLVQLDRVLELAKDMDHHGASIQPFVAAQRIRAAVGEVLVDHIPDPPALRLYGDGFSTSDPAKLASGHLIEAVHTERLITTWYLRCTAPHKSCEAHRGTHLTEEHGR